MYLHSEVHVFPQNFRVLRFLVVKGSHTDLHGFDPRRPYSIKTRIKTPTLRVYPRLRWRQARRLCSIKIWIWLVHPLKPFHAYTEGFCCTPCIPYAGRLNSSTLYVRRSISSSRLSSLMVEAISFPWSRDGMVFIST